MNKGWWFVRYTVYHNKTDTPVIIDGTAEEAMKAMGLANIGSFYSVVSRALRGTNKKWSIIKTYREEFEVDD